MLKNLKKPDLVARQKPPFYTTGIHKDTGIIYDPNGFDINGIHNDTGIIYDPNDFDRNGNHKHTKDKYDPNDFDRNGNNKHTKDKYDPNGFDRGGYNINGVDKNSLDREGNNINGIKGTKKNIQKEKLIINSMMMALYMISMDLIQKDLVKIVTLYMDLIKMD